MEDGGGLREEEREEWRDRSWILELAADDLQVISLWLGPLSVCVCVCAMFQDPKHQVTSLMTSLRASEDGFSMLRGSNVQSSSPRSTP